MLYSENKPLNKHIHPMILNKSSTQLLVATLGCTLPGLVGVSLPAVAFDFQLQGTLGPATSSAGTPSSIGFSTFSGTFSTLQFSPSTPGNLTTYKGDLTPVNISFSNPQGFTYTQMPPVRGSGIPPGHSEPFNGGIDIEFRDPYPSGTGHSYTQDFTLLSLFFYPDPANPSGLSFSSGKLTYDQSLLGLPSNFSYSQYYSQPVTSATITPVPAPVPIGGVLFLPGLAYSLLRKKR